MYIEGDCTSFCEYANYIGSKNLVYANSGNLSCRGMNDGEILIKETGRWMETMDDDNIVRLDMSGKRLHPEFEGMPSMEWKFHVGILKARTDVNVVLHFQSDYATIMSCTQKTIAVDLIPELSVYCRTIREVPYLEPGSDALANAVVDVQKDLPDIVVMRSHGAIAIGTSFRETIQKALFFELACKITIQTDRSNWSVFTGYTESR